MTLDRATDILYEEATRQGIAISREACDAMARKLFGWPIMEPFPMPGDIARHHRERYEEDANAERLCRPD